MAIGFKCRVYYRSIITYSYPKQTFLGHSKFVVRYLCTVGPRGRIFDLVGHSTFSTSSTRSKMVPQRCPNMDPPISDYFPAFSTVSTRCWDPLHTTVCFAVLLELINHICVRSLWPFLLNIVIIFSLLTISRVLEFVQILH